MEPKLDSRLQQGPFVRFIYLDEAGTSKPEPVRVVAGPVIHADDQMRGLCEDIERLFDAEVHPLYRDKFWFHAKEVFNGGKEIDREVWSFDNRLKFYKNFLNLLQIHRLPIVIGCIFSGSVAYRGVPEHLRHKVEHMQAFSLCIERADFFLRHHLREQEAGTIVAEDLPNMKKTLSNLFSAHARGEINPPQGDKRPSRTQRLNGIKPRHVDYHVKCIIDVPHFVEKGKAPILQIADACAFAFRRCLAKQKEGNELVLAMLGKENGGEFIENDAMFELGSGCLLNVPVELIHSGPSS